MVQYAEEFRVIRQYTRYRISNKGRVFDTEYHRHLKLREVGIAPTTVRLVNNRGEAKQLPVAELVLAAFEPKWDPKLYKIGYRDKNMRNLKLGNLRLYTHEEYARLTIPRIGTVPAKDVEGIINWWHDGATYKQISEYWGYHTNTIGSIIRQEKKDMIREGRTGRKYMD